MANEANTPFLKYALFCKDTTETDDGELSLNGIVDLFELPEPDDSNDSGDPVLAPVDYNLAFCIGGVEPGDHYLFVTLKTPGIPLETPPAQKGGWGEVLLFQRRLQAFRIPVQQPGKHAVARPFDGLPQGGATFLVRFKSKQAEAES